MAEQRPKTDFDEAARNMKTHRTTFRPSSASTTSSDSISERLFDVQRPPTQATTPNTRPVTASNVSVSSTSNVSSNSTSFVSMVNGPLHAATETINTRNSYNYIIIGAGTSGCILANKLSSDVTKSVLVLEAGDNYLDNTIITNPLSGNDNWIDQRLSQVFPTTLEHLQNGDMKSYFSAPKTLGGGSSTGQMLVAKGGQTAWDLLATRMSSTSWNYVNMSVLMEASETFNGVSQDSSERGTSGPINIRQSDMTECTLTDKVIDSMVSLTGDSQVLDYNGSSSETCVCKNLQWFQKSNGDGTYNRVNMGTTYLSSLIDNEGNGLGGRQIHLKTGALVKRVVFDSSLNAIGVEYEMDGKIILARVTSKVILAAGIMSSVILLRSGIGPYSLLQSLGLPQVYNNAWVGKNIQNHVGPQLIVRTDNTTMMQTCTTPYISSCDFGNVAIGFHAPQPNTSESLIRRWMVVCNGTGAYITPEMQNIFGVTTTNTIHFLGFDLSPSSQGEIYPTSSQTNSIPIVNSNFYNTDDDIQNAVDTLIYMYDLFKDMQTNQVEGDNFQLVWPPEHLFIDNDRTEIFKAILAFPNVAQNWTGGCAMLPLVEHGVVDASLNVYGVNNLMVADTSIFPNICTGPPEFPAIAIAQRACNIIQSS